jgi:hypothetical protein
MILRFDDGLKCCCDRKFPICQQCDKKRRKRYRGNRDDVSHDHLGVALANRILAKRPVSSSITWLELSAGRSNS